MTETAHTPHADAGSCSGTRRTLTLITWALLLVCVIAWMAYASALLPALAATLYLTGIISGALFLLFFISQIVG